MKNDPVHSIDAQTGYIESNAYVQAFDADKKVAFLKLFYENGLKFWRTCDDLGVKGDTVHKHLNIDPRFREDLDHVKRVYYDDLEGTSRINAMNPKSVIERIFQLKAAFPERYGDGKRDSAVTVNVSIDGKFVEMAKKRQEMLEAQEIPSTQPLARESMVLSDKKEADNNADEAIR